MDYSEKEILATFKDKECLHKESQRITHVFVKDIKISEQGVKLKLEVINSKQAVNFYGDLEYEEKPEELKLSFRFMGDWQITSFRDMRLHIAYVSAELNANPESIRLFKENELDFFKLWQRNK